MDKKEHILEIAEDLFARKGFEGTSVRDLAKKAEINIAMVSYYFGSKEKLFEALVEHHVSSARERLQSLNLDQARGPMEKIELIIDYYVDKVITRDRFSRILIREMSLQQRSAMHHAISDILLRNLEEVRKIVNDGVRKKIFRKVDTDMMLATIMGTIVHASHSKELICRILNRDPKTFNVTELRYRNRIKNYLKELFRSYLLIHQNKRK